MIKNRMCHFCICPHCNLRRCRHVSLRTRCQWCSMVLTVPTVECDHFESRYYRRCYRVVRRGESGFVRMMRKVQELIDALNDRGIDR